MDNNIHLIGNAHLDPTWLWKKQEGCAEVLQTFQSAADRLKEYDGFVFTCSSACYYKWVEELKPELFEEIKKYVAEGRWVPVNGWWVQPDCNMPSAESFARQALYSQLYYYEKFGIICTSYIICNCRIIKFTTIYFYRSLFFWIICYYKTIIFRIKICTFNI